MADNDSKVLAKSLNDLAGVIKKQNDLIKEHNTNIKDLRGTLEKLNTSLSGGMTVNV